RGFAVARTAAHVGGQVGRPAGAPDPPAQRVRMVLPRRARRLRADRGGHNGAGPLVAAIRLLNQERLTKTWRPSLELNQDTRRFPRLCVAIPPPGRAETIAQSRLPRID